jgi:hypothetical protein
LTGIRIEGQLMEFETSLCVVQPDWKISTCTIKEGQRSTYFRNGKMEAVKTQLVPRPMDFESTLPNWTMSANETVEETELGAARIDVEFTSKAEADIAGAYLRLNLPASFYSGGKVELINPAAPAPAEVSLAAGIDEQNEYARAIAGGVRFISFLRQLEVFFGEPTEIIIRDDRRKGNCDLQVYLTVMPGKATADQTAKKSF